MQSGSFYFNDKFIRLEIAFFIIYYLLFPLLTSLEYSLYEAKHVSLALKDIPERFIYGFTEMIPSWLCYKILIQKFLFEKKYLRFSVLFVLYLIAVNFYQLGVYLIISNLTFLPSYIIDNANRWYIANLKTSELLHFLSIYSFREVVILSALAYYIRSVRQERQISELKQQQLESELNYLKVQLQPHFFFNTLNNIYALTLQRSEKAAPLVAKHSEMMRYILYDSSGNTVTLRQEIAFLKNYVEVEAVRYPDKIDITFETQGINDSIAIEPLLLLPFVENTFKHGIREETNKGYIHVIICLVENELSVEISNSKVSGVRAKQLSKGIGLQNVVKRLDILYPKQHILEIKENDTSYEIRLTLVLKSYDTLHYS